MPYETLYSSGRADTRLLVGEQQHGAVVNGVARSKKRDSMIHVAKRAGWPVFGMIMAIAFLMGFVSCFARAEEPTESAGVQSPEKQLPLHGEVFRVKGHTAFLLQPEQKHPTRPTPWVWYAPTLPGLPGEEEKWMFEKFLDAGIAIAGIDVGESYGSPQGRDIYSAFYEALVQERGLSKQPCLLARSRGGLMLYNWAADHPSSVACIAGIYPVCNLSSLPGLKKASDAYNMSEEQLAAKLTEHNPIERLEPLSKANVPVFLIHGDSDKVVPLEQNSGELAKRYRALGGEMTLKIVEGQGHNMWPGWFQCQELVDFVVSHARNHSPNRVDSDERK
jgi:hypothetical protein